ncbi:MAG: hypothetical protein J2P36_24215 [Ktedonobacteraceae bacterium]|nr:hypothetical protein [Ktedonobacteraceae bacterium]
MQQIEHTFRAVEQSWREPGRAGRPHLVAQIDIALEQNGTDEGRKHVLDYYATLSADAVTQASRSFFQALNLPLVTLAPKSEQQQWKK